MTRFLKENVIFIISSIILLGLFVGVSVLKKIPATSQVNVSQEATANNTYNIEPKVTPVFTKSTNVTQSVSAKPVANTKTISKPVSPAASSTVNTQTPRHLYNNDDNSENETE
jgi:hypothetical protein